MPGPPLVAPARTRLGFALQVVALGALYFAAARASLALLELHGLSPPLWCPAGIGLAGLLLLGVRAWPAIAVAAFFTNLDIVSPGGALVVAAGNTLAAALPAWLLRRRSGGPPSLEKLGDVLRLLWYGAIVGPGLSAFIGLIGLRSGASHGQVEDLILVLTWFVGCVAGIALITPLLLAWTGPRPSRVTPGRWPEMLGLLACLFLAGVLTTQVTPLYALLAFPLVTWAALRFGTRGVTLAILAIYGLNALAGLSGHMPLPGTMLLSLRLFYTAVHLSYAATGLLLAASAAERQEARQVERSVEDAYRALIAASPLAITGLDLEARVTVWSHAAEKMFGWRAEEVIGKRQPNIPARREAEFQSLLTHRDIPLSGLETVRRHKDGHEVDVLLSTWPLYDDDGRLRGSMSAKQDISERKRAQDLQEATYRISHAALTAADPRQLYAAIHGIVSELMPARNLYIALFDSSTDTISFPYWADEKEPPPEPRRARKGLTEYVIRSGRPLRDRSNTIGSLVAKGEVESLGAPAADWLGVPLVVAGRPVGVLTVQSYEEGVRYSEREQAILEFVSSQVAMVIERKRAEDIVRASEEELRALFAAMRDVIFVLDREGRYRKVAPTNPELLYIPADQLVGRRLHDVFPAEIADRFLDAVTRTLDGGRPIVTEYALPLKGEDVWFSATASPVDHDTVIWVARSINEQRKAEMALRRSEDQLRQATKMEAVGRLAGGVAHDFNNLLTSVLGHADLAMERIGPGDSLYDDLLEIKSAGSRAAALTHQLLAFSRKQVLEPRVMDLNTIVSGIAKMLRRTIGEDVELVTRLSPELGRVRADPVQMEQVLLNLAVNARDAMPEGGRLTIETMNIRLPTGPGVRMRVDDTGVGMSEEVRAHLFEPFFTTKDVGKGTGLGLATAYGIVQQSGGSIAVTSEVGRGTTFLIDLPQVSGEAALPLPPAPRGDTRGTETVLLVEDEEAVRNLTRRVLEHQGYHVLSAPNGESALELSRGCDGKIHLLLTDVVMPGMSGPRLAEIMVAERDELRCIFMSGYAATTLGQKTLLRKNTAFLQKPFTTEQLARRVREALDFGQRAWEEV
jgi:two-component system, cell cycle sensor histidine kinase and response regulator CckA